MLAPRIPHELIRKVDDLTANQIMVIALLSRKLSSEKIAESISWPLSRVNQIHSELREIFGDFVVEAFREHGRMLGFRNRSIRGHEIQSKPQTSEWYPLRKGFAAHIKAAAARKARKPHKKNTAQQ